MYFLEINYLNFMWAYMFFSTRKEKLVITYLLT